MFSDDHIKKLPTPVFFENYKYYINCVDNAEQLRCYYISHRTPIKDAETHMALLTRYYDYQLLLNRLLPTGTPLGPTLRSM